MKKIVVLLFGIIILALGTAICNFTGLGIDPFNALCVAIAEMTNIQLGTMVLMIQALIAVIVFIFKREDIGFGTIVPIATFGYFLQFFDWAIPQLVVQPNSILINLIIFVLGMLTLAFGMTTYMQCRMGMVPYDALAFVFEHYFKRRAAIFRISLDVTIAVIAFLLGGPISIGTVLLAVSVGPLIDFYRTYVLKNMFVHE